MISRAVWTVRSLMTSPWAKSTESICKPGEEPGSSPGFIPADLSKNFSISGLRFASAIRGLPCRSFQFSFAKLFVSDKAGDISLDK